ncbi:hypothetical protein HC028_11455 [Planosporangium flavigriseum]|uniref:Uncharacterized protein n=1 Tax=Planosporangium flavigriseum TaxID=373681 RepID=A0A8J3LV54_9ACTN|nr:hypothetical protein [Planosporangium flavigriseum]NJC65114.1 hypothetical protein [Planosporangium flavigriseum]GIG71730.1 hypothetical protein Pfl04_01340 [Planosporangium flavigriseum]
MEDSDIARIKATHRPRFWWLGRAARLGCRCGSRDYPCSALATALEAERRAAQPILEQQVTDLLRRQYDGSTTHGAGGWAGREEGASLTE